MKIASGTPANPIKPPFIPIVITLETPQEAAYVYSSLGQSNTNIAAAHYRKTYGNRESPLFIAPISGIEYSRAEKLYYALGDHLKANKESF